MFFSLLFIRIRILNGWVVAALSNLWVYAFSSKMLWLYPFRLLYCFKFIEQFHLLLFLPCLQHLQMIKSFHSTISLQRHAWTPSHWLRNYFQASVQFISLLVNGWQKLISRIGKYRIPGLFFYFRSWLEIIKFKIRFHIIVQLTMVRDIMKWGIRKLLNRNFLHSY